ncbi:transposable element Tcb2 transposase [Trichonephila clavipes]|nr:transposable element Tcb2 transposase [Trichonephila clavipes]
MPGWNCTKTWWPNHGLEFFSLYFLGSLVRERRVARSPDVNPIEHLCDVLEQGVKGHRTAPTNLTELWTALANIWQVIPMERFQKLVESIPRRVAAIIKARGGPTRY